VLDPSLASLWVILDSENEGEACEASVALGLAADVTTSEGSFLELDDALGDPTES